MTEITPLYLAQQSNDIYSDNAGFEIFQNDTVYLGYRQVDDTDMFVFRGSKTMRDWLDDLIFSHDTEPDIGWVDKGMFLGVRDAFDWCKSKVRENCTTVMTGHSLGGAHARFTTGLFVTNGLRVNSVTVFGCPKCSGSQLKNIFTKSPLIKTHMSYRFNNDIVPMLPNDLITEFIPYVHTEGYVRLIGVSSGISYDGLNDHHIANYIKALQ